MTPLMWNDIKIIKTNHRLLIKITAAVICASFMFILLGGCQSSENKSTATTIVTNQTTDASPSFSFDNLKEATLITVLEAPVGIGDGELSYGDIGDNGIASSGPSDFAVAANGDIYVLDNYHGNGEDRISVYSNGKWERNINLSANVSYGISLTIFNDSLYVFDHNYYQGDAYIVNISFDGTLLDKYIFNKEDTPIDVWRLFAIDEQVVIAAYSSCYALDDATQCAIKSDIRIGDAFEDAYHRKIFYGYSSWIVPIDCLSILPTPLGKTNHNEPFVAYGGDKYICKCDDSGKPLSIAKLDELLKDTVYIKNGFYVALAGSLYIMIGHKDAVRIYKFFET